MIKYIKYVFTGLILFSGFFAQAGRQNDWKYTQFPLVKPNQKIALPSKIVISRESLKPILHPKSGTHKLIGVDQIYISKNSKRRIFIKQNVKVSSDKILNQWMDLKKGSVYHFKKDSQIVAIFAQGYNERSLNEIEKNFTRFKSNRYSSVGLMSLFVECANAESEIGISSDPMGVNPAVIEETYTVGSKGDPSLDQDVYGCIFAKTGQGLWDSGVATKDAVVNGASALWNDPMGAARATGSYLYDTGVGAYNGAYDGAKAVGGAIASGAVSSYNYVTENYDDPNKISNDMSLAYDSVVNASSAVYNQLITLGGFTELPTATKNIIICEVTAMAVTSLGISGVLALTGVGSAAAVAKATHFINGIKRLTTRMLPLLREFGTSGLSATQKKQIIQGILNGKMTDDQAWAMMKAPDSKPGDSDSRSTSDVETDASATSLDGQDAKLAANSKLNPEERVTKAEDVLTDLNGGKPVNLTPDQQAAILKSHEVGLEEGRGYGTWTQADISQKARILKEAGFTEEQRRALMDEGVTGAYGYIKRDPNIPFSSKDGVANIDDVLAGTNQMTTLEAKSMAALRSKAGSVTTMTDLTEASEISLDIAKYQATKGDMGKAEAYLTRSLAYQTKPLQSNSERVYRTQLDLVQKTNYFGELTPSNFADKYPDRSNLFTISNFTNPVNYLSVRRIYNELSLLNFMTNNPGAYPGINVDNRSVKAAREKYERLLRAYEVNLGLPPTIGK